MSAGYSGTPLARKLGIKSGMRVLLVDPPPNYWELVRDVSGTIEIVDPAGGDVALVHLFTKSAAGLAARLREIKPRMRPDGMLWVSWPKRASGVPTDLTENVIRDAALAAGLVDVKVCAVDDAWSGLKLVIRRADRPGAAPR